MLLACFFSLMSTAISPASWGSQHFNSDTGFLLTLVGFLLSLGLPFVLLWRHRWPFILTVGAAVASVVVPIGNTLAFILLAALIGRRRGPAVWWTAALVACTSIWVVVADALASPIGASLIKTSLSGSRPTTDDMDVSGGAVVIVALLGIGVSVGLGLIVRARREAKLALVTVEAERATSGRLGDEVARRQERERVAREVHDALGHRLSLLNLHAGALEANAPDDPRMAQSAHLVRESATAAMDDLRSLLDVLRDPKGGEESAVPLSRLAEVVAESAGAGQSLNSSIFISDPDAAHPTLTRGVYRIVQELLTNARKHAPGEALMLMVQGNPQQGIVIDARNPFVPSGTPSVPGGSRGLPGIAERVHLLGGTMQYGVDGPMFRVHVELPWRPA